MNTTERMCKVDEPRTIPGFPHYGHLNLQGVSNARDLGGMPTSDGRHIRKRRLIRSSALHDATAEDMKQLTHMHDVDCVVDFRTDSEVSREPDPLPLMDGIKYVHTPVFTQEAIGITTGGNPLKDFRSLMDYAGKPYEMISELYPKSVLGEPGIKAYKEFLHDLLDEKAGATLWHCSQGKDRTGIGAILVEYALGVPFPYIRDDYLATNYFVKGWAEKLKSLFQDLPFAKQADEDLEAYAFANTCYFEAMMDAIDNAYGSLDNYFVRALDFGQDEQAKLRELYLTE